ncbi:hypothetical protein [Archangium sp.]|uniref:hypothetical protein n=1 Tax=Archangium sp. TaxID=1872627 RepID=UPI00389AF1F2
MLWRVWDDVRRGAAHFHQRNVPLPVNRLEQFVHGLCLPFHVARVLWAERATRRRYLTVSLAQVAVIVALGVVITGKGQEVVETVGPEEWSEAQEEELAARVEAVQKDQEEELQHTAEQLEKAAVLAERMGVDPAEVRAKQKAALREIEKKAREERRDALKTAGPRKRKVHRVVYWAALFSSLNLAQWLVIALSRDYHTVLMREASVLTGLPPEDEPISPRVRLNPQWLRKELKQHWRGMLVFSSGVPLCWLSKKLVHWGGGGELMADGVYVMMLSAWGAWWFVVYTAGKSSLAWREQEPREPWYLRGLKWLTARAVPLRPVMGTYGSLWTKFTREMFSPAASVERQPWSLGGLAVARTLASIPLVKCFLRPIIPVAVSHLLVAGAASEGEGVSPRPSAPEEEAAAPPGAQAAPPPRPPAASRTP